MKAAAMSVWIFINLLCFGMCGYLYLIWSQYWMSLEKQRLFSKSHVVSNKNGISGISFQETFSENNINTVINMSLVKADSMRKRSVVSFKTGHLQWSNKSFGSQMRSNNIVVKSRGSPRFPNLHKAILELDSDKYVCSDLTTSECETKTTDFKELLLKEFHRVLMSESKVFTSGLDSQNPYDVKYERGNSKSFNRNDILCALGKLAVRTVKTEDEPFARQGFRIPNRPLQENRMFNTCAVVTSAGALLGSRLGEFIDSHDMVLRFNNAPTENYTDDVGSKTSFRILNSQVATKPEYKFLEDKLYNNISILIWDPANFSSTLEEWYRHPDFPVFSIYKRLLNRQSEVDVHLLHPRVLWNLWTILQDSSPYRLRRNPPSSGFIGIEIIYGESDLPAKSFVLIRVLGLWFSVHRCNRVRVFEYVPSVRATRRCHYHGSVEDAGCTLGAWHPLAQEKLIAHRMSDNSDVDVFQRGFIDIPGIRTVSCKG